ncbi:MAG: branched-chain amino acid ABC transporter permease [Rhodobacteraceae bacterium]|nr:branched-chain amino acid ABC transporter permease [Paracoccaceae bacterium]
MMARLMPLAAQDRALILCGGMLAIGLALLPAVASALVVDKLTLLFIYVMLAVMWNLMAGYAGLVSVGQQAFLGLGGYAMVRLVEAGMPPFPAILAGAVLVAGVAWLLSGFVLRMKAGEFAIATWVLAEVIRSLVSFDPLIQGETGTSVLALNAIDPDLRRTTIYLMALGVMVVMLAGTWRLLAGRLGAECQAIRDDEEAAASVGVSTMRVKRQVYIIASVGCAVAGALWLASAITFQPRTAFGVQWSVFMLFMVLVGGFGSFTGPILGAVLFFALQEVFGDFGAWYLAGLGVVAILFALYLPRGLVGLWQDRGRDEPLSIRKRLAAPGDQV